jgi:hypothetical protein
MTLILKRARASRWSGTWRRRTTPRTANLAVSEQLPVSFLSCGRASDVGGYVPQAEDRPRCLALSYPGHSEQPWMWVIN